MMTGEKVESGGYRRLLTGKVGQSSSMMASRCRNEPACDVDEMQR